MLDCLMLDVDGVLITGRPHDGRRWNSDLHADLGIDANWLGAHFFAKYWDDIVEGRDDLVRRLQACLDQLEKAIRADVLIDYWFAMDSRIEPHVLEDCANLRARGVVVYLATNQEPTRAHYLMKNLGLGSHVDGMIYSANVGASKPKLAFYEAAQAIAGISPSQIMLIDDLLPNVTAAKEAGWHATHWDGTTSLLQAFKV